MSEEAKMDLATLKSDIEKHTSNVATDSSRLSEIEEAISSFTSHLDSGISNSRPFLPEAQPEAEYETGAWIKNHSQLRILGAATFLPEYAAMLLVYWLAQNRMHYVGIVVRIAFFVMSCFVQFMVFYSGAYADGVRILKRAYARDMKAGDLKFMMGCVPVGCLRIPKWMYKFAVLAPQYAELLSTSSAVGSSWKSWRSGQEITFEKHWSYVPLIGGFVGRMGLPALMTWFLGFGFLAHGVAAVFNYIDDKYDNNPYFQFKDGRSNVVWQFEASNMLFIAQTLALGQLEEYRRLSTIRTGGLDEVGLLRLALIPTTKLPMLWLKVSLLATTFDDMTNLERIDLLFAIALSFYYFVPFIRRTPRLVASRHSIDLQGPLRLFMFSMPLIMILGVVVCATHLLGVYICPSHDFSILHGCTVT